jgi:hypothetical protein
VRTVARSTLLGVRTDHIECAAKNNFSTITIFQISENAKSENETLADQRANFTVDAPKWLRARELGTSRAVALYAYRW